MPVAVPSSAPKQTRAESEKILRDHGIVDGFALLGIRGYYLNTLGEKGKNDRGIYDDAIILVTPMAYVTFNANCDPSVFRKGIATLKPGVYQYRIGIHGLSKPPEKRYKALVQAGPVIVTRDGGAEEIVKSTINIHRGYLDSTSSEGCQTIYKPQYESFIALVESELKRFNRKTIPYVLVEVKV